MTRWVIAAVALLVGIGIGAGIGLAAGASDPKQSKEYRALMDTLGAAQDREHAAEASALNAEADAGATMSAALQSVAEREAALASSEAAVSAAYQTIQANSITEGVWTVGTDIAPGTYRTADVVSGQCYWKITRTGSNGDDIVQNDIVNGGRPTVTLSVGQDFTTQDCGTWMKQ